MIILSNDSKKDTHVGGMKMNVRLKKKKVQDTLNEVSKLLPDCKSIANDIQQLRGFDIHLMNILTNRIVELETKIRFLKFDIDKTYIEADKAFKLLSIAMGLAYLVLSYCFTKLILS